MTSVDDYHTALAARRERFKRDADLSLVDILLSGFKTTGIAIAVWIWGYFGMSVAWIFVFLFFHIVSTEVAKQIRSKRKFALQSMNSEKGAILSRVDERQSWIYFPELERAEWLNKMIKQLWPVIADYAENLIMTTIQDSIQAYMPSNLGNFKFTHADMGDIPMRIEWVKVYIDPNKKEEIVMDLNIKYDGDSSIKCEVKGITFGIKTLQVRGNMRVVMNPLINEMPIIGGLSAFFLNTPEINFDMLAAANLLDLPVIKRTIRDIVSKVVSDMVVLPRRIPISLNDKVDLTKIRYPPPEGLVVVHILEAKDLRAADVNLIGKSKSDPYCTITIGNQVMKTKVVQNKLNPNWDQFFQAVVDQKHGQSVDIRVYDHDQGTANDDSLGNTSLDIDLIAQKETIDTWLPLANAATGSIHVRALWMEASNTMDDYKSESSASSKLQFASAILLVVVESAKNLPISPNTGKPRNPYVRLRLGDDVKMTSIKHAAKDPEWNENFNYFLSDPQTQTIELQLMHKGSSKELLLGHVMVPVSQVFLSKDLSMSKTYDMSEVNKDCSLSVRFMLRVLKSSTSPVTWSEFSGVAAFGYGALMKPDFSSLGIDGDGGEKSGGFMNFGELGGGDEDEKSKTISEEKEKENEKEKEKEKGKEKNTTIQTPEKEAAPSSPMHPTNDQQQQESTANENSSSQRESYEPAKQPSLQQPPTPPISSLPSPTPSSQSSFGLPNMAFEPRKPPSKYGQVQLTMRYSPNRSTLVVVVHQCKGLIPCDRDNLADPYVRIYLLPDRSSDTKRKTKVVKNTLDPVFDETFEWVVGNMELPFRTLEVGVKNDVGVFSRDRVHMGQLMIKFNQLGDLSQGITKWLELKEEE